MHFSYILLNQKGSIIYSILIKHNIKSGILIQDDLTIVYVNNDIIVLLLHVKGHFIIKLIRKKTSMTECNSHHLLKRGKSVNHHFNFVV